MKKTILYLCMLAFFFDASSQTIITNPTTVVGEAAVQLDISDAIDFPGYYARDEVQPADGYSYFWFSEQGFVSHKQNPTLFFPNGGSTTMSLVLTPRKRPDETRETVKQNAITVQASNTQNESRDNFPLYFSSEPKVGKPIYLVVPLNSCEKPLPQEYAISVSDGLVGVQASTTNVTQVMQVGNVVYFTKDWATDQSREDVSAVFKFTVNADIGQEVWVEFIPGVGNCQKSTMATGTVTSGPYDPNYKASDLGELNTDEVPSSRMQATRVRYTIHFQNIGEGPVDSVTITDVLPQYLSYVGNVTGSHQVTTSQNGKNLQWVLGSMTIPSKRIDVRGTNELFEKPLQSTKGWIAFDADLEPTSNMPIVQDTCYCLCNYATVYFNDLAPIETKADIIAIGNDVCFEPQPNGEGRVVDRICYDTATYYKGLVSVLDFKKDRQAGLVVSIYPNPTTSLIYLNYDKLDVHKVEIYRTNGKLIQSKENEMSVIDLSEVQGGLYLLRVFTSEGVYTARVIRE